MILDVYICNVCGEEFAVKEDVENVKACPVCVNGDFEFSHEANLLEQK